MRTLLFCLIALVWVGAPPAFSQTDKALLRELAEENKKSVEALALYPEDARLAILEAAKYPEVLIKMKSAKDKTSAAFRTLIEDFPRNTQSVFYDLSRYPGLVGNLVSMRDDHDAMRRALETLPEAKRAEALGVAERQMGTLIRINDLQRTANRTFDNLVAGYTAPAQDAFRKLLDLPEVLDILNEDLRFTVLVGDVYRENPAWVIQKMDSLSLAVARNHAEELDEWKRSIENDPEARTELQSAAREYADTYGYTDDLYDVVDDDLYDGRVSESGVVEQHYYYHYPYWFGYPWWAPDPWWRPYPYWWYWGFYPAYHTVVIVHLPYYHFMHWYFGNPHHHYAYNHLSTHFVNHYYGHRHSGTTIAMGVGEWRDRNREVISDAWLGDRARVSQNLREYGRFEEARQQYNTRNPGRAVTPKEYLDKNPRQYPELERSRAQAQTEIQRERADQDRQRSQWAPAKAQPVTPEPEKARAPRTDKPVTPPAAQPVPPRQQPTEKPKPGEETPRQTAPPARKPNIDDAKDYHRDRWQEETRRAQPPAERQVAPERQRQTAPPRQSAPKTERQQTPAAKPSAPAPRQQTAPRAKTEKQRGG